MNERDKQVLLMRLETYAQRLAEVDDGIRAVALLGTESDWARPDARLRLAVWFGSGVSHALFAYKRVYKARLRALRDWADLEIDRKMDLGFHLDNALYFEGKRIDAFDGPITLLYPPDTGDLPPA